MHCGGRAGSCWSRCLHSTAASSERACEQHGGAEEQQCQPLTAVAVLLLPPLQMLLALVPAGGHIVTTTDCYRRTRQFIQTVRDKGGCSGRRWRPGRAGGVLCIAGTSSGSWPHPHLCLCGVRPSLVCLQVLPKMGITATVIDPADMPALEAALEQHTVGWLTGSLWRGRQLQQGLAAERVLVRQDEAGQAV